MFIFVSVTQEILFTCVLFLKILSKDINFLLNLLAPFGKEDGRQMFELCGRVNRTNWLLKASEQIEVLNEFTYGKKKL